MTSWMECGCGGDVTLYENPGAEYLGRKWPMLFAGNCRQCGRYYVDVPGNMRSELEQARRDHEQEENRMAVEERKREQEEYKAFLATLSPEELLAEVGPDKYPWFHVFVHRGPLAEGQRAHGIHEHALTLESARRRGTVLAQKGDWITIERDHERIESFEDGSRPKLRRYYAVIHHDYRHADTGEVSEVTTTFTDIDPDECWRWAEWERRSWLDRSATYFSYQIRDDDGNVLRERHYGMVMEAEE